MKKSLGVIVKAKNDIKKEDLEEHIPAELMSMSKWDMMKYSKPREGLSKPQIYLKVRGAWTDVYQGLLSISSVYLNYNKEKKEESFFNLFLIGLDSSSWLAIDNEDQEKYIKYLKDKKHANNFLKEF